MPRAETRHRIVRFTIIILVILYLLGTILGGIGLAHVTLHPGSAHLTSYEEKNARAAAERDGEEFRDVELQRADGAILRAWFLRPANGNGNAVILLHGVSDNRLGSYGFGKWLLRNHYAVLLPDARAHSLSTGMATYGLKESDDIHGWVNWLEENDHPRCVYGLGESMGAAQLLQSLPKEPRFCAVVAESPFASFREIGYVRLGQPFHMGPWLGRTFFRPALEVGFLYARICCGLNLDEASPEKAVEHTRVPILLIHGLEDHNIPNDHSDRIKAHNPSIAVWKVPGAGHVQAHRTAPEEFDRRVLDWFESHPSR